MREILERPWFPYVFPFALFMLFTAVGQYVPDLAHLIYVTKTIAVGLVLFHYRNEYRRDLEGSITFKHCLESIFAGIVVLAVWIGADGFLPTIGVPRGFDPAEFSLSPSMETTVVAIRLLGAAVVVPVMEELFWRSFLMRYLINTNFRAVRLGTFTWFSFMSVTVLFGLEHFRVIQGLVAGAIFSLLVIRQNTLKGAVISHAVANLGLGLYVLNTESWHFW